MLLNLLANFAFFSDAQKGFFFILAHLAPPQQYGSWR
jgi:hypothetical protein